MADKQLRSASTGKPAEVPTLFGKRFWKWAEGLHHVVTVIGGIASVAVAVTAIVIQQQLHDDARESRQVDRAIATFDQFMSSQAITSLVTMAGEVEPPGEPSKLTLSRRLAAHVRGDRDFHAKMIELLRQVSMVSMCGNFDDRESNPDRTTQASLWPASGHGDSESICDRDTLLRLFGETLTDIYFTLRPALYCDDFFKLFEEERARYHNLLAAYLQGSQGIPVYRSRPSRTSEPESPHVVLDFVDEPSQEGVLCGPFERQPHSVERVNASL